MIDRQRTHDRPENLVVMLRDLAQQWPDKPAFRYLAGEGQRDAQLTYSELDRRARSIAGQLQQIAVPSARALLVYPPGLDFIAGFFACLYAGVIGVPVSVPRRARPTRSLDAIIDNCAPSIVLTTQAIADHKEDAYQKIPQLIEMPWLATDESHQVDPSDWKPARTKRDALAFLQYTSGSTGNPKGVMVSHDNLLHNLELIQRAFGTSPATTGVFWLPLYHDMGLIGGMLESAYCAGTSSFMSPAAFLHRPLLWLQEISRLKANISGGPDFAFDLCARKSTPESREGLDLSHWDLAFTGAEPIRGETIDRFCEAFEPHGFRREAFFTCYGLAEATLLVSGGPRSRQPEMMRLQGAELGKNRVIEAAADDEDAKRLVGSGGQLQEQRIVIADPETRQSLADDRIGEIWVAGPSVAKGYFNSNGATERVFQAFLADTDEGPFLRTGDLGFCRDGELFVTGRWKDMIIVRGRNYCPQDIEGSVEAEIAEIRAACSAAFSVEVGNQERLVVVHELERRQLRSDEANNILEAIRRVISGEHDIEVYAVVLLKTARLPRTSSGKVRRYLCRQAFLEGKLEPVAQWVESPQVRAASTNGAAADRQVVPRSPKEVKRWLIQKLAAKLDVERRNIDINKPLFEFGMSSLDTVSIASDLENWIGIELSPTAIYNYPTIEVLSGWIAEQTSSKPSKTASVRRNGKRRNGTNRDIMTEVTGLSEEELLAYLQSETAKIDN